MEDIEIEFPLRKLKNNAYFMIDVMMYVEYEQSVNFMFAINKEGRGFL